MNDKLKLLLDKLKLPNEYYKYFETGKILKLKLNKERTKGVFEIEIDDKLPDNCTSYIDDNISSVFNNMESVSIKFIVRNLDYSSTVDMFKDAILNSSLTKPMKELFMEKKVSYDNYKLTIEVDNIAEQNIIGNHIDSILDYYVDLGFKKLKLDILINPENALLVKKELEEELKQEKLAPKKEDNPLIHGEEPKGNITKIKDIIAEEGNVIVEAYVFGVEEFESTKSAFKILTFMISDNTDSIYAKFFTKDKDDFKNMSKKMKSGWFRIQGYVKQDQFAKDLVLNIRNVMKIPSKDNDIVDDSKVKRVELHAHTMMSQMDGITKVDLGKHTCELVTNAINMGYRAVAITDHNGCQAFPIAFGLIKGHNKKIEDKSKHFKGLYGTELTLYHKAL